MSKQNVATTGLGRLARAAGVAAASATLMFAADASAQMRTPEYHVVTDGDTLYDLSGSYYGDVYQWPKMWSHNAHITNPHWIYPGDIIYLKAPSQDAAPVAETEAEAPEPGLHMPVAGFVTSEKLEYSGRIVASPKEANMLSPLDLAWVGFGEDANDKEASKEEKDQVKSEPVKEGDLFAIVRDAGDISDSEGEKVGHKYLVVGALRITEVSEKYHDTAIILQAWQEIERGDKLIRYERQLKVVQPVKSDKDMVAEIVDGIYALFDYAEFHYIFVNRGAEDGIRPGNRFFIYQRREGLTFQKAEKDDKVPWRRVGQVMVVDVREKYSLAVVTDSSREVQVGDRLEMYEGY